MRTCRAEGHEYAVTKMGICYKSGEIRWQHKAATNGSLTEVFFYGFEVVLYPVELI